MPTLWLFHMLVKKEEDSENLQSPSLKAGEKENKKRTPPANMCQILFRINNISLENITSYLTAFVKN